MAEEVRPLDQLAADWLEAERLAIETDNSARFEERARTLSDLYDKAIASATPADLEVAWKAAEKSQADLPMGSIEWRRAGRVTELLRTEFLAASQTDPTPTTA
jgi:hypothetical protein